MDPFIKLINAETACYKAEKFAKPKQKMQKIRASQLSNLVEELTRNTNVKREASVSKTVRVDGESSGLDSSAPGGGEKVNFDSNKTTEVKGPGTMTETGA